MYSIAGLMCLLILRNADWTPLVEQTHLSTAMKDYLLGYKYVYESSEAIELQVLCVCVCPLRNLIKLDNYMIKCIVN